MKISKLTAAWKLMTGGVAGLVEYILDLFNEMIQTLPKDEVAKYAQLAKDVANFISNLCGVLIKDEDKKVAALLTADAFAELAVALLDAKMEKAELDSIIDDVKKAIDAWKAAK